MKKSFFILSMLFITCSVSMSFAGAQWFNSGVESIKMVNNDDPVYNNKLLFKAGGQKFYIRLDIANSKQTVAFLYMLFQSKEPFGAFVDVATGPEGSLYVQSIYTAGF